MNWNRSIKNGFFALILLAAVSCTPQLQRRANTPPPGSTTSTATGWTYQNERFAGEHGFATSGFAAQEGYKPQIPGGMVMIEGGTFVMGEKTDLLTAERNNLSRRVTVGSFYMDQYEVSNLMWREYTHWMDVVFGETAPHLVQKAQPNIDKSSDPLTYNEPYFDRYFSHPAFNNYPVVGVSWEQAMDYCQWRTDRLNELVLVKAGVIAAPDFSYIQRAQNHEEIAENFVFNTEKYLLQRTYNPAPGPKPLTGAFGEIRKAQMGDGLMFPNFRLPTEAEWEFAAYGLKADKSGLVSEGRMYPWTGDRLRETSRGRNQGQILANFSRGRGDMMGTAGDLNDGYTTTAPGDAYPPNDFGLYNMAGNVNEWVLDVYRSTSHQEVADYNPYRGNQSYTYLAETAGTNERFAYKVDSLGRIARIVQEGDDLRSYRDGREQITTDFQLHTDPEGLEALRNRGQIDPTDVLAPKISNKTRVYKGGSWKDRAYWLNPATRRYLDQDKSANDIGFRCAMTMLGSLEQQPANRRTKR